MAASLQCRKTCDKIELDDKVVLPTNGHECATKREYQGMTFARNLVYIDSLSYFINRAYITLSEFYVITNVV